MPKSSEFGVIWICSSRYVVYKNNLVILKADDHNIEICMRMTFKYFGEIRRAFNGRTEQYRKYIL
jgi:hypothetical protein